MLLIALTVTGLAGLYLVLLGLAAWLAPAAVGRYLLGFAGSPGRHLLELGLRIAVGLALIVAAPRMPWPAPFLGFGWLLVVTTLVLACVPWQRHRQFAQPAVTRALARLPLIGAASLLGGLAILASVMSAVADVHAG